jgi:hypothetical protein
MLPSLNDRLSRLPSDVQPLSDAAWQHRLRGANLRSDGTVQVAPMPWVSGEAFAFVLYPPAEPAWITALRFRVGEALPDSYARLLAVLNGCFAFGLALYGLAPSLQPGARRSDRHALEPLDLEAANRYWAHEYRGAEGDFHFGGCSWTATENVGYFLTPAGRYLCRRKDGDVLREWGSLRELLAEELPAAEARDRERLTSRTWPWELRRGTA